MTEFEIRHASLFCGLGGGSKGFNQARPDIGTATGRFRCIGGIEIAQRFPEQIDRIEQWEAIVAAANKRRSATFFPAVTDPTDRDRPGTYSRIRTLVEWAQTDRGGRQFAMFFGEQAGGGCTSDLGLCETESADLPLAVCA